MKKTEYKIKITEKDFRQQVVDLARILGYMAYFSWTSIHSPRGFPDLVLCNPEQKRIIYAELKSEKGKPTEKQVEWLNALDACGQEVYLWRPSNFEVIVEILNQKIKELEAE